jgi:hypothetical protein
MNQFAKKLLSYGYTEEEAEATFDVIEKGRIATSSDMTAEEAIDAFTKVLDAYVEKYGEGAKILFDKGVVH